MNLTRHSLNCRSSDVAFAKRKCLRHVYPITNSSSSPVSISSGVAGDNVALAIRIVVAVDAANVAIAAVVVAAGVAVAPWSASVVVIIISRSTSIVIVEIHVIARRNGTGTIRDAVIINERVALQVQRRVPPPPLQQEQEQEQELHQHVGPMVMEAIK